MEKSRLQERPSTSVNVTVGRPGREYLTEREVERLIESAKQNRCGHRDATAILVIAMASGRQRWWLCVGMTSTSPPGAYMFAGQRAAMLGCIRSRRGKAEHCATSCAKRQHHPTSSFRNVAHRCP
jgi:hypothetical protein